MVSEYALAETPEEAGRLVAADPDAIVMAGGTTVMPRAMLGELSGRRVIGLARAGLDTVSQNGATTIGATTPLHTVAGLDGAPLLAAAAQSIGSWALRTTATAGGNLLVGSPYGDLVPPLLALDAEITVAGADGTRRLTLADALAADSLLEPGELLTEIVVPAAEGATDFQRCARRAAGAPSIVTVAARIRRDGEAIAEARLAIGAVGPRAMRIAEAEDALVGSAGGEEAIAAAVAAASSAVEPADDSIASAWYRARMVDLHVRRALQTAAGAA